MKLLEAMACSAAIVSMILLVIGSVVGFIALFIHLAATYHPIFAGIGLVLGIFIMITLAIYFDDGTEDNGW